MKEKLRKEETTVFIGVSIALLEIISGREAVMKYNGTKQTTPITSVRIQKTRCSDRLANNCLRPISIPNRNKEAVWKKRPYPHAHNRLNNWPSQRLDLTIAQKPARKERIPTLAMNTPNAGCRHIVRIYHRIEKLAEFERLEHQDNSGNEDRSVAPSAD